MAAAVETKVKAATAASALSGLALWALGRYVFKGAVPDVVASWVYVIVASGLTFGAGYLATHTARPGDPPAAAAPPSGIVRDRPGPSGPEMVASAEILRGRPAPPDVQPLPVPPAQPPAPAA